VQKKAISEKHSSSNSIATLRLLFLNI